MTEPGPTRLPKLRLLVWLAVLAVAAAQLVLRTPIESDLGAFLPSSESAGEAALLQELQSGRAAQLLLAAISGGSESERARTSRALAEALRAAPAFSLAANGSEALDPALLELLLAYRYLLSPEVSLERFTAEALAGALGQRLDELASPVPAFDRRWLARDPTAEVRAILSQWRGAQGPILREGVWFSEDGERALLLLRTRAGGYQLEAQQQALAELHAAFESAATPALRLQVTGPAVFAVNARDTIQGETRLLALASTALLLALLLAAYRSPRLLLLGALPLASGMLIASACVSLVFGGIHGITLAFGVTLLGVAVDYPLHLFSHLTGAEPAWKRVRALWPTLRLGVLSTVAGYAALGLTDFSGLAQLGLFTVTGLLSAAAVARWILPALVPQGFSVHAGPIWRSLSDWAMKPRRVPAWTALAVLSLASLQLISADTVWEDDLAALSPIAEADRRLDGELRAALGAGEARDTVVLRAPDLEALLQASEALEGKLQALVEAGAISGFELPSRYLPSVRTQQARQAALPAPAELRRALSHALEDLPFRPEALAPFLAEVEAARTASPLTLAETLDTPLELRLLPLLSPGQAEWHAFIPLAGVRERAAVAARLATAPTAEYLDLKASSERLLRDFRLEALQRVALGALAIVAALWLGLRSPRRVLLALLPVAAAVVTDLALLLALGERLSLFHLIALLLVTGLGVDYSLFFGREVAPGERWRTVHAVGLCAASSAAVFGLLGFSDLPVLRALGLTVGLGVALSFLYAWALRFGRFGRRGVSPKEPVSRNPEQSRLQEPAPRT